MLVGEIGISRHEFLYEIQFWETLRIIDGYNRRNRLGIELARLTAYYTYFSMRDNKTGKRPKDLISLPWDDEEIETEESTLTEEGRQELVDLMRRTKI